MSETVVIELVRKLELAADALEKAKANIVKTNKERRTLEAAKINWGEATILWEQCIEVEKKLRECNLPQKWTTKLPKLLEMVSKCNAKLTEWNIGFNEDLPVIPMDLQVPQVSVGDLSASKGDATGFEKPKHTISPIYGLSSGAENPIGGRQQAGWTFPQNFELPPIYGSPFAGERQQRWEVPQSYGPQHGGVEGVYPQLGQSFRQYSWPQGPVTEPSQQQSVADKDSEANGGTKKKEKDPKLSDDRGQKNDQVKDFHEVHGEIHGKVGIQERIIGTRSGIMARICSNRRLKQR